MRSLLSAAALSVHIFLATVAVASAHSTAPATNNSDNEANVNDPALTAKEDKEGQVPVSDNEAALIWGLKELVSNRLGTIIDRNDEKSAVQAFYGDHGFQPIWTTNGALNQLALAVIKQLQNAATDGLNSIDYPIPDFAVASSDEVKAADEIALTHSVLSYVRHLYNGRVSFTRVSGAIVFPSHTLDYAQVLTQIVSSKDIGKTLSSFEPPQVEYKALKAQLAKELAWGDGTNEGIQYGTIHGSKPKQARAAQNERADTIALIMVNMEKWRWLPRDLGIVHVTVNIPDYTLQVVNNGNIVWQTKVVVGKPGKMATPLLSETMKYLTINPTWNVPPSIIRNEYLPALERDPDALERIGLRVERNHDGSIRVYQPPGAHNALGRIRFNFPNPFLVYQHDTPNKNLFALRDRALSHGCMRVQNPEKYAEILLSLSQPEDRYTVERIRKLYGDNERTINLQNLIPVHVTYQTAFVDAAGHLNTRDDIYGLDAIILKLMRGRERSVADTPIARNYESSSKPVIARLPTRSRQTSARRDNEPWDWSEGGSQTQRGYLEYPYATGIYDRAVGSW
jgi:murein L,D-transpeptidase YcbB/YkuD